MRSSVEARAIRPTPLADIPPRYWALNLGFNALLETVIGGLPAGVVIERPVTEPEMLVFRTCSWAPPALAPVSAVVALTVFVCPRLNTPPIPLPAIAVDAAS